MYFNKRGRENYAEKLKFSLKEEKVEDPEKAGKENFFFEMCSEERKFSWPSGRETAEPWGPGGPSVRGYGT